MKHGFIKRLARKLAILFAALLAVFVLFILEENLRGRILLSRYKAELRAKGEKLTLAELNLPKPTKPSDAAVDLLGCGGALHELSMRWQFEPDRTSDASAFRLRFSEPGCCIVRRLQPDSGSKLLNVSVGFSRGLSGRSRWGDEEPPPVQMCSWEQFAEQVALAREPLRRARAALQQPVIAVPIDYSQGFEVRLPQCVAALSIRAWLSATALYDLHQKDLDAALGNILAIADLMRFLEDGRIIVLQTLRIWTGERGLDMTWEALQAPGWTDEQLAKLQTAWEKASAINEFAAAAEGERAMCLDVWEQEVRKPMRQSIDWSGIWDFIGVSPWEGTCDLVETVTYCLAWKQQDQQRGVWLWQHAMENVRSAVKTPVWTASRKRFDQPERDEWSLWSFSERDEPSRCSFYDRWRYHLSVFDFETGRFVPTEFRYDVRRLLEYETRREMTVAAIALARYQLRRGKMPANLATLVPEFCAKIPHDYMDGSELRYRLNTDGSWVLYSVGDDGVDNGGDPTPVEPRLLYPIWDGRDAVWPQPATTDDAARVP
ncbi:MAG: hypothetical protein ABSH21_00785 [Verrucomicrobiia bacterium]|jgi:hypothetical protein